jgi:hypothetical protein
LVVDADGINGEALKALELRYFVIDFILFTLEVLITYQH